MEVSGVGFPIPPLITSCQKIVRTLHDIGKKFKRAPLMMTSIASECGLIHVALTQLRDFDWSSLSHENQLGVEQMIRATETIILGCTLTLSVIEEYATELKEYVDGSKLSPTEQMGVMSRVRVFWKEDEMRELLVQLRGYQSGLTDLLRAAHDDFGHEEQDFSTALSNFASLLNRSRNSRSKKPLSIKAAMQQSVAYSSLSRSNTTSPTINHHVIPPRTSSGLSSSPPPQITRSIQQELSQNVSPMTADLYDGATTATANRKPVSDKARKKRPAFLALHSEDTDTQTEANRYAQSRKDREHLRRSSPTVGENFTFLEAASDAGERAMPEQARDIPKMPNGRNGVSSRQQVQRKPDPQPEPEPDEEEETENEDEEEEEDDDDDLEDDLDGPPPPPSAPIEQNGTPMSEKLDPITEEAAPQPRKQKSTSSVRDQIIGLPEQARLRKQASGELAKQQQAAEERPTVPPIKAFHAPNKVASHEMLNRRRQSDMPTNKYPPNDGNNLAHRRRGPRSASQDARPNLHHLELRPHPTGPLPPPPIDQPYPHAFTHAMSPTSSRPMSPASVRTVVSPNPNQQGDHDAWPLTPDMSHITQQAYLHSPSTSHSRNTSEAHSSILRSLSPDATPRPSRSATPLFTGTAQSVGPANRGRSRSNTNVTLAEEVHSPIDDASSLAPSVAPSQMSAQWYRSPQERLGLGGRIVRPNVPPNWEQMSQEEPFDESQLPANARTKKLYPIYPQKMSERVIMQEPIHPEHPPRSPLLTDKFLTDVNGLPQDAQRPPEVPQRTLSLRSLAPRRALSSRQGDRTPDPTSPRSPRKKDSRFPTLGELVTEYKSLANKWYTSQDDDGVDDPSTSTTSLKSATTTDVTTKTNVANNQTLRPRPSRDTASIDSRSTSSASRPATSGKNSKASSKKKKKKPSLFSEMRAEYKSLASNWYSEAVQAEEEKEGRSTTTRSSSRT